MKDFGTIKVIMFKTGLNQRAEIDEKGFTRFINIDGNEVPMTAMDNFNPTFAQEYLEFRGWVATEVRR